MSISPAGAAVTRSPAPPGGCLPLSRPSDGMEAAVVRARRPFGSIDRSCGAGERAGPDRRGREGR